MDQRPGSQPPVSWIEALERSATEIAAGKTVPILEVLDAVRANAHALEARLRKKKLAAQPDRGAVPSD